MYVDQNSFLNRFDENEEWEYSIFFKKVNLEDKDCYEIIKINYKIEYFDYYTTNIVLLNDKANEVIKDVFQNIDFFLFNLGYRVKQLYYKYYVLDKVNGTFSVLATLQRMEITKIKSYESFLMQVSNLKNNNIN